MQQPLAFHIAESLQTPFKKATFYIYDLKLCQKVVWVSALLDPKMVPNLMCWVDIEDYYSLTLLSKPRFHSMKI